MSSFTVKSWAKHSYPLLGTLCTESDSWLIYFPSLFILLLPSLVRQQPANQKCWMKSMFFLSRKAVGHLTFVTCPTGQLITGNFQWCQYKIYCFIISKSNKCLKDVYFSWHMSKLLMFWFLKILKHFPLLYFVSCSRWTYPVWFCYMFRPSEPDKSCT